VKPSLLVDEPEPERVVPKQEHDFWQNMFGGSKKIDEVKKDRDI